MAWSGAGVLEVGTFRSDLRAVARCPGRSFLGAFAPPCRPLNTVKTQLKKPSGARQASGTGRDRQRIMQPSDHPTKAQSAGISKESAAASAVAADDAEGVERAGNVDKIRDILFGSQMRDYDRRFARFEERLLKETADLRDDVKRRFESLETFVRAELESLGERLQKEQQERTEAIKELTREQRESQRGWEKKTTQLEEQANKNQRELRQQLLEESKRLGDQIEQKSKEAAVALEREIRELGDRSQDRFALADMLTELAMRLKNEFEIPDRK